MSMKDAPRQRSRRWFSAGSALLLAVAAGTVTFAADLGPRPGTHDRRQRLPAGRAGPRRDRHGRADVAGGAAGPLGPAHRPQRHPAPHRRRRHHHGRSAPCRSTPTTRRGCRASASTRASPPTGTSTSTTPRRSPPRAATRRPPAPTSPPGRRQPAVPVHPQLATSRSTSAARSTCSTSRPTAGMCCHVGGDIDFDAAGNLYLSTGDDTNPFESVRLLAAGRADQPQPRVRRAAQRRQHQRPARQDPADQGERQRHVLHPVGQPVRPRHGQHPAGDLRDGVPQPVPDERGQGHRRGLRR